MISIKKQNALTEHVSSIGLLQKQIILIDSKIRAELGEFKKRTLKELVEAKEKLRELETKKQGASAKLREFLSIPQRQALFQNSTPHM